MPDTELAKEAQPVKESGRAANKRNRLIGMAFIFGPYIGLVLVLLAWAVSSFVVGYMISAAPAPVDMSSGAIALSSGDSRVTALRIVNVALGFLGILCVVGMLVGIPLGLVFMRKRDPSDTSGYDQRSGKGDASVVPEEIKGWNWGAAGLTWIWGIYYNVWISLLCFIPIVNLFMMVYLGLKGNELAWQKNKWMSVEEFRTAQGKWQVVGIVFFFLGVLSLLSQLSALGR